MPTILEDLARLRGKKEAHELVSRRAFGVAGVPTGMLFYTHLFSPQNNLEIALFALILGCLGIAVMSILDARQALADANERVRDYNQTHSM